MMRPKLPLQTNGDFSIQVLIAQLATAALTTPLHLIGD